jgi:hypothetical protein
MVRILTTRLSNETIEEAIPRERAARRWLVANMAALLLIRHEQDHWRSVMEIGYARVSTLVQTVDLQTDALTQAGCGLTFTDTSSGARAGHLAGPRT